MVKYFLRIKNSGIAILTQCNSWNILYLTEQLEGECTSPTLAKIKLIYKNSRLLSQGRTAIFYV